MEIDQQPRPPGYFVHHTAASVLSRGPGKLIKESCYYGADIASETILIQNLAHTEESATACENVLVQISGEISAGSVSEMLWTH